MTTKNHRLRHGPLLGWGVMEYDAQTKLKRKESYEARRVQPDPTRTAVARRHIHVAHTWYTTVVVLTHGTEGVPLQFSDNFLKAPRLSSILLVSHPKTDLRKTVRLS